MKMGRPRGPGDRRVAVSRTHIDYFQGAYASKRGIKKYFGIRVWPDRCQALLLVEGREPFTFGITHELPINCLEAVPDYLAMIIEDHLLDYPHSDLMDVLSRRKSFQEAVDAPAKLEANRAVAAVNSAAGFSRAS